MTHWTKVWLCRVVVKPDGGQHQQRGAHQHAQVVAELAIKGAGFLDPPDEVEGLLDIAEQGNDRDDQGEEPDSPERGHVRIVDVGDDPVDHLLGAGGNLVQDERLHLVLHPEPLQDGKGEGEKGDQRKDGGEGEGGGADAGTGRPGNP